MARYDHLQLVRLPERLPRRKTGGGGPPPKREPGGHSQRLSHELDTAVAVQQRRRRADVIDPALILRVQMSGPLLEEEWNKVGLVLLSSDEDRSLVLFSSSDELTAFRRKLASFGEGPPAGQINPSFANFIANIESIAEITPRDRIGMRAREAGLTEVDDFSPGVSYLIDIELWDLGPRDLRERKVNDIVQYAEAREAEELDRHIGPNLTLLRLRSDGGLVRTLLGIEEIAEIDFPPEPDLSTVERIDLTLAELPELEPLGDEAPLIGIIDSGINDHPLIEDIMVGAIAVPDSLGTADDHGHGTFVGGVATFGDLRAQLGTDRLARQARLCSAKVIDKTGSFPKGRLIPRLMREAITRLNAEFGCRIFVIALGDRTKVVEGGKVGPWAQTLDELVRELDLIIVVAAGNRKPRGGVRVEEAVTEYPAYLMEVANRLCEPAGGMNIISVGAIAHGDGLSARAAENVGVQRITESLEPSPLLACRPRRARGN